jgi:hypothetical protein
MKPFALINVLSLSFAYGAHLQARQQDNCNRNNCYIAVWGSDPNLVPVRGVIACERHLTTTEIIYPLYVEVFYIFGGSVLSNHSVTSTFAQVTLTTTTVSCLSAPVTSVPTNTSPSASSSVSLTSFIHAKHVKGRQIAPPQSSTTTTFGPVPTGITGICDVGNYRSACLCKSEFGITSGSLTLVSTVGSIRVCIGLSS